MKPRLSFLGGIDSVTADEDQQLAVARVASKTVHFAIILAATRSLERWANLIDKAIRVALVRVYIQLRIVTKRNHSPQ